MNALTIPSNMGALSTRFQGQVFEDDLSSGISGGFPRMGFKGKVWTVHSRGESYPLIRQDGSGDPLGSIEVVIVKSSQGISKTYYAGGFVEGSTAAPDCMSSNGVTPDPSSPNKQCSTCALCPKNVFGSDVRQDGTAGKGKACKDTKRLAIVPLNDLKNEVYGGAMLLRVPAASLQDIAMYGKGCMKLGYPYYAVGTRIGFDPKEAFPKLTFSPIRALTDPEADIIIEMQSDPAIDRILAEDVGEAIAAGVAAAQEQGLQFEQPTPVAAPAPAQVAPAPAPVQAPAPAQAAPKPAPGGFGGGAAAPVQAAAQPVAAPTQAAPKPRASRGAAQAQAAAQAAPQPAPAPAPAQAQAPAADVEADLDAKLAALMGE